MKTSWKRTPFPAPTKQVSEEDFFTVHEEVLYALAGVDMDSVSTVLLSRDDVSVLMLQILATTHLSQGNRRSVLTHDGCPNDVAAKLLMMDDDISLDLLGIVLGRDDLTLDLFDVCYRKTDTPFPPRTPNPSTPLRSTVTEQEYRRLLFRSRLLSHEDFLPQIKTVPTAEGKEEWARRIKKLEEEDRLWMNYLDESFLLEPGPPTVD